MSADMTTGRAVVAAFAAGDAAAVVGRLARDVTFHSPVTDYQGRERVAEVLAAVVRVLRELGLKQVWEGPNQTAAFFTARVDGRDADGVLLVVAPADRPATELTLMLRPLATLVAGIEVMKVLLGR
jgi:SnoaL-like domain